MARSRKASTRKVIDIREANKIDMPLLICVLLLLALGIIMVLSASAPSAIADYGNSYRYVLTQGVAAVLGLIAMYILSKFNYNVFKKYYKIIYYLSIVALLLVLIPGLGVESNGARRWINLGLFQLQPNPDQCLSRQDICVEQRQHAKEPRFRRETVRQTFL